MSRSGDEVIAAIHGRRSTGKVLPEPIAREEVEELLAAAVRAPNHHLTFPWRFVVLAGDARREVGEAHARAVAAARPDHPPAGIEKEAARLERAPVVIAVAVAGPDDPATAREDRDAVAAGVQNLLLAAHARGLGAMWRSGAMVEEPEVREALGLADGDELVGFVYLGRPAQEPPPRERPPLADVAVWRGW
ncbi:MAG: nitroreductase [Thermoleophilia bacterium]